MPLPDRAHAGSTDLGSATLAEGAIRLGCPLSSTQVSQLQAYQTLLQRWNRVYNLTAIRDDRGITALHLLDSLAAIPPLDRHAAGRPMHILDAGSGGGLPGVVFAIARPAWRLTGLDAVAKKARFVQQVAIELTLPNLQAIHARVEAAEPAAADVVVSRAFASLRDFTAWTARHLAPQGVWLALKGRVPQDEIAALPASVQVFHVEPIQVPGLDAERCLVWMRPTTEAG